MCFPSCFRTVGSAGRCVHRATARCLSNSASTTAAVFCGLRPCRCSVRASLSFTLASAALAYGAMVATHRSHGLETIRAGLPRLQEPPHRLRLPHAGGGQRAVALGLGPGGAGLGLRVAHDQQRPGLQFPAVVGVHEVLQRFDVARVAQEAGGLLGRAPHDAVDFLAVRQQGGAVDVDRPVVDHLQPGRHVVVDGRKRDPQGSGEPDLLLHLADGALRDGLAGVDFALRPGPVVIPRAVDQQDLELVLVCRIEAPRDGACRRDGNLFAGMVSLVRNQCIAAHTHGPYRRLVERWREREASSQDWTSLRFWPSSARWWRVHSPCLSRCQLAVSGTM